MPGSAPYSVGWFGGLDSCCCDGAPQNSPGSRESAPAPKLSAIRMSGLGDAMSSVALLDDEWRLLVEIADGVQKRWPDHDQLRMALDTLLRLRLVCHEQGRVVLTARGRLMRADNPPPDSDGVRVWHDSEPAGYGGK